MRLLLASGSPRRRDLLGRLGVPFEVSVPDVDEALSPGEAARDAVIRLASRKAEAVPQADALVLGADTLVSLPDPSGGPGQILGKPRDRAHAASILRGLSGREHEVWTGVAVARGGSPTLARAAVAVVRFREISELEISTYISTGEPMDKAGAYAIQGRAAVFVDHLDGELETVVGLPLGLTRELLSAAGWRWETP